MYSISIPGFSTLGVFISNQVNALRVALEKWTALWQWKRRSGKSSERCGRLQDMGIYEWSIHGEFNVFCFFAMLLSWTFSGWW
jgi:hypothetical protein